MSIIPAVQFNVTLFSFHQLIPPHLFIKIHLNLPQPSVKLLAVLFLVSEQMN